ncbi:uncharacterized protein METZ01_LOCUS159794, partial [marine metagenome]
QLTMDPAQDFHGDVTITVTVTDDGGLSDTTDFVLNVDPVNDAPVIIGQVELETIEETSITIVFSDLLVEDVDNDYPEGFTLTVLDSGDFSDFYSVGIDSVSIIPGLDFNGTLVVPVYVNDGEEDYSQSDIFDLEIAVTNLNDSPILGFLSNQVTNEDTAISIILFATDVDNDSTDLIFSGSSDNENVSVSLEGNQLTMTPDLNFTGSANITAEVTDGQFTDSGTFLLTVVPINDPPELGAIGPQVTPEDTDLILILSATDVDNTELYFEASSDTSGVITTVEGDLLTLSPAINFNGIANITVTVSDLFYTSTETFVLTVIPVNDPPNIDLPESFTFAEDSTLVEDFTDYIGDIDEDDLTLTVSGNENITISIDSFEVTFRSAENWNGVETLTFTVNDHQGRDLASDDIDIIVLPVNDQPVLVDIDPQETDEDNSLTITLSAIDPDEGDEVTFGAVSDTDAVGVLVIDNQLTMTPDLNFNGIVTITVTVTDNGNLSDETSFLLTVTPVNDPPTITLPASFTFAEDGSLIDDFTQYINDVDENELILTVSGNENITISIDVYEVTFEAVGDWYGEETLTFMVNDSEGRDIAFDDVLVIVTPVNDMPELVEIGPQETDEDISLTITLPAEDVDNSELIFSAESDNESVIVSLSGDQLTMLPEQNYNGFVNITVTVSDGFLTDFETFELSVNAVNDAPILYEIGAQLTDEDIPLEIILSAVDVDEDLLIFEATPFGPDVSTVIN